MCSAIGHRRTAPQKPMRCWRRSSNGMESPSPVTSEETNLGIRNAGCRMAPIGNMTSIGKHPADRAAPERLVIEQRSGEGLLY